MGDSLDLRSITQGNTLFTAGVPMNKSKIERLKTGGLVLCGGRSRRMGLDKASLPFGPETMLSRVVRKLSEVVSPIVVVAAKDQTLPELPKSVLVARDLEADRGPLQGLFAGMSCLQGSVDALFATSCDVPLLIPDFVQRLITLLGTHDVVVPVETKYHHPLAAVYHIRIIEQIQKLLNSNRLRPVHLYEQVHTRRIDVQDMRSVDPHLSTLANLNRPEEYLAAVQSAGFSVPPDVYAALQDTNDDA
jgi:molybdopterin-guanine dinucleotide biosynthesis protein A